MSEAGNSPGRDEPARPPERPTLSGRRSRALIVGTVLGVALFVIAFMLLVSRCGTGDDGGEVYGAPAAEVHTVALR
jgi:hypothetical protein